MTTLWAGLATGAIYALVAIGYNVVLLTTGVVNFAQAAMMVLGSYLAFQFAVAWGLSLWLTAVVVAVALGLIAWIVERIAVAPLVRRGDHTTALITTVGAATVIQGVIAQIWGRNAKEVPPVVEGDSMSLLGGTTTPNAVVLILLVLALGVGLHVALKRTILGLSALATAEDPDAASLCGVRASRLAPLSFVVAGTVSGLLALSVGAQTYASISVANAIALPGFVAVAIGGSGSLLAGVGGGFFTGIVYAASSRYLSDGWPDITVFGLLLLVLLLVPHGLFARHQERAV